MDVVWMPGGVRTEIQLDGADTGGAFCLLVDEPPAGWSLPPHLHREAGASSADAEPDLPAALAAAVRHGWEFSGPSRRPGTRPRSHAGRRGPPPRSS